MGQEIISWANNNKVILIKELDNSLDFKDYRDNIHLEPSGNRKIAISIYNILKNYF